MSAANSRQLALLIKTMRDRAERATPGPWFPCGCRFSIVSSDLNPQEVLDICDTAINGHTGVEQATSNTEHIAFFDPATCKLIADILEQQAKALSGIPESDPSWARRDEICNVAVAQSEQLAAKIVGENK